MSKFKDDIAEELFKHLEKNLSYTAKSIMAPIITREFVLVTADFIEVQRLNDIFDQAIKLHKALLESHEVTEEESESFMDDLKNL